MDEKAAALSYVPVIAIKKEVNYVEYLCGFILKKDNRKFIVTASHGIPEGSKSGLVFAPPFMLPNVLFFRPTFMTKFRATRFAKFLKNLNDFLDINFKVKSDELLFEFLSDCDVAYCEIPTELEAYHSVFGSNFFGMKKLVLDYSKRKEPVKDEKYCFAGLSYRAFDNGILRFEEIFEKNIDFIGKEGESYVFSCSSDKNLHGCSGAPIFDSAGNLVSMVVKQEENKIYGFDLNLLDVALGIEGGGSMKRSLRNPGYPNFDDKEKRLSASVTEGAEPELAKSAERHEARDSMFTKILGLIFCIIGSFILYHGSGGVVKNINVEHGKLAFSIGEASVGLVVVVLGSLMILKGRYKFKVEK